MRASQFIYRVSQAGSHFAERFAEVGQTLLEKSMEVFSRTLLPAAATELEPVYQPIKPRTSVGGSVIKTGCAYPDAASYWSSHGPLNTMQDH